MKYRCIFTCMYACMYVLYIYIYIYIYMHAYAYTYTYKQTNKQTHTHTCMHNIRSNVCLILNVHVNSYADILTGALMISPRARTSILLMTLICALAACMYASYSWSASWHVWRTECTNQLYPCMHRSVCMYVCMYDRKLVRDACCVLVKTLSTWEWIFKLLYWKGMLLSSAIRSGMMPESERKAESLWAVCAYWYSLNSHLKVTLKLEQNASRLQSARTTRWIRTC
jgi:hypothetical protein